MIRVSTIIVFFYFSPRNFFIWIQSLKIQKQLFLVPEGALLGRVAPRVMILLDQI
jgi:hypothetical protein